MIIPVLPLFLSYRVSLLIFLFRLLLPDILLLILFLTALLLLLFLLILLGNLIFVAWIFLENIMSVLS